MLRGKSAKLQIFVFLYIFVKPSVSSPTSATTTPPPPLSTNIRPNAEISYSWHQKGHDLLPLWPLESPTTGRYGTGPENRVILIHRISDDLSDESSGRQKLSNTITVDFSSPNDKVSFQDDNNVFVFCLMFLFGLIICGLMWCLCTVSRHQVDTGTTDHYGGTRRLNSQFGSSRRRADVQVILPYGTRDLPPSYDDIVADFEKLGAQCILPSYKDIMTKCAVTGGTELSRHHPTSSPPPRYTSPVGSFSGQGNVSNEEESNTSGNVGV